MFPRLSPWGCRITGRFKETETVRRSLNAPFLDVASRGAKSRTKQHLDAITTIRFQRRGGAAGAGEAKRGDKDLFVPE